jgi:hypothetical protein
MIETVMIEQNFADRSRACSLLASNYDILGCEARFFGVTLSVIFTLTELHAILR